MARELAELLHELPRLRGEFEVSRQLAAQAVDRAKRLTERSQEDRRLRWSASRQLRLSAASHEMFFPETVARTEHLSDLIDALPDYSRLSVHFRPSQVRTVDMNEIVRAAVTLTKARAALTTLQLRAECGRARSRHRRSGAASPGRDQSRAERRLLYTRARSD
jgi:hypothetical protein